MRPPHSLAHLAISFHFFAFSRSASGTFRMRFCLRWLRVGWVYWTGGQKNLPLSLHTGISLENTTAPEGLTPSSAGGTVCREGCSWTSGCLLHTIVIIDHSPSETKPRKMRVPGFAAPRCLPADPPLSLSLLRGIYYTHPTTSISTCSAYSRCNLTKIAGPGARRTHVHLRRQARQKYGSEPAMRCPFCTQSTVRWGK